MGDAFSAALLGFDMPKEPFVATATAIGLMVDAARMPVYFATEGREMSQHGLLIAITIAGVIAGARVMRRALCATKAAARTARDSVMTSRPDQFDGLVARMKALANLSLTSGAIRSTSRPLSVRNARASSTL